MLFGVGAPSQTTPITHGISGVEGAGETVSSHDEHTTEQNENENLSGIPEADLIVEENRERTLHQRKH